MNSSHQSHELEVDIDGRTFRPVPESWVEAGEHHQPGSGAARRYATLAAVEGDEILVRYVHPADPGVVLCRFEAVDVDTGSIPAPLVRHELDWPRSITRDPWADVDRAGEVRMGERDVLWSLHGDWLEAETAYSREQDDRELVADGGQVEGDTEQYEYRVTGCGNGSWRATDWGDRDQALEDYYDDDQWSLRGIERRVVGDNTTLQRTRSPGDEHDWMDVTEENIHIKGEEVQPA